MKDSKAVYVRKQDFKSIYTNRIEKIERDPFKATIHGSDFSSQYNSRRDRSICTCKKKHTTAKFYNSSHQVYRSLNRYLYSRGFADIGIGSVKTLPKKRVRKIYLPDIVYTGVGSSDLTSFVHSTKRSWGGCYYDQKKTSSKCVGGLMASIDVSVLDKKLSPITQTKSDSTSPENLSTDHKYINSGSYTVEKSKNKDNAGDIINNKEDIKQQNTIVIIKPKEASKTCITETKIKETQSIVIDNKKTNYASTNVNDKNLSSDSLLQHIYNLETPSLEKKSKTSLDPMENKLEREYRKIFSMKPKLKKSSNEKPIENFKSASILRRRFEALRQGLGRKKDSKKDSIVIKTSSKVSVPSHKDVSIVSDPPSLEARSFSNTKVQVYSPKPSLEEPSCIGKNLNAHYKENEESPNLSTDVVGSDYQGVKGMFKLWGKKFNLDDEHEIAHDNSGINRNELKSKIEPVFPKEEIAKHSKKEGKMFSFFRKKKSKDKSKHPYKSKKGVTAGRCEVGDGLMIKIGVAKEYSTPITITDEVPKEYNDILRDTWLKTFVAKKIESRKSAHIRWNNKMYATSSSTVFELIDCVYKNINAIPKSRSEINIGDSSSYYSYTNHKANFINQNIKAWMIPKTILDKQIMNSNASNKSQEHAKNIEITFSNRKWFVDKSEAFSRNIEIVLHSNNIESHNQQSSEYITINIPEGYFSDIASDKSANNNTSNEEVFKVVEYETQNSCSCLKQTKKDCSIETGDHIYLSNDIEVTVSVKDSKNNESKVLEKIIKRPPLHRDVVIQGSNVYVPKRCDVIGVGIITQKDIRDIKKPILKIHDYLTDEESEPNILPQKQCEFAESYLQDYYRNWTPFGMDLSACVSDSQLRDSSENNSLNSLNQGDGSKSCPNIYDDFQASTIVSSCATSSCSQCRAACVDDKKQEDTKVNKFLCKFKKKISENVSPSPTDVKRLLPKDSLEVFKRRKIYAASNKSNWGVDYDCSEPLSVPSVEDKCAQKTSDIGPKTIKPCCKRPERKKTCPKRVLLPDCETMEELLSEQMCKKAVEGILTFKGAGSCETCTTKSTKCHKHAKVIPEVICEIPQPGCKDSCLNTRNPPCSKKNSPTCNNPAPPPCPVGFPSPCQKPCPPIPPPCQRKPTCPEDPTQSPCKKPPPCHNLYPSPPCERKSPPSSPQSPSFHKLESSCSSTPFEDEKLPRFCCPKPLPPKIHSPKASPKKSPCQLPLILKLKQGLQDCLSTASIGQSLKSKPCDLPDCPSKSSIRSSSKGKQCSIPECPSKSKVRQPRSHLNKNKICNIPNCPSKSNVQQPCKPKRDIPNCTSNSSIQTCPPPPKCKNSVSQETGLSLTMCPSPKTSFTKQSNAVKRLMDKVSSFALGKIKECKPNCANRSKTFKSRTPSPPPPTRQETCFDDGCKNKLKQTGLHLKKMPSQKRTCSDDCVKHGSNIIRLNSKEEIFIKLKQGSPSTEEIREGYNIKVKDEDGRTLIERRDYRKSDCKNRTFLVRDMYRDSHVNRVSTSNLENNAVTDDKSVESKRTQNFTSLSNIIEINLTLKFKHTEKTEKTEITTNNADEIIADNHETSIQESPKEVYIIQDDRNKSCKESDKKDLNIKVIIKNFKQNEVTNKRTQGNLKKSELLKQLSDKYITVSTSNFGERKDYTHEKFSNKISEKFNTVSTGYSEILLEQQAYSIHETAKDLTNSTDNNQTTHVLDENVVEVRSKDNILLAFSTKLSKKAVNETDNHSRSELSVKENLITDKSSSSNIGGDTDLNTASYVKETATYVSNANTTISDRSIISSYKLRNNKKHPSSILKPSDNKEKNEVLKEIFETASILKRHKKKDKIKLIRQMLHAILTPDSSELEEPNINNKLADEVAYASLKPNYCTDTDSMKNYCHFNCSGSDKISSKNESEEQLYPTKDNTETSECSSSSAKEDASCLCSHIATKLNTTQIDGTGCCCRRMERKDEEINCDLRNENFQILNYKTEYVNVETQDSKFISGKIKSVVMTNMSTTVKIRSEVRADSKKHEKVKSNVAIDNIRLPTSNRRGCQMTTLVNNIRDLSKHNKPIMSLNSEDSLCKHKSRPVTQNNITLEDILQLNETKKAVLEIYAERTVSDEGQHIVAKLPKFVSKKGGEMRDYKGVIAGFKHYSKRNVAMVSINR